MLKIIVFFSIVAICGVSSLKWTPFQPFQHYLKSNEKFNGVARAEDVGYRLGDETAPSEYDIKLMFNTAETNFFTGEVAITFQTKVGSIHSVVLNGENIEIKDGDVKIVQKVNPSVEFQGPHNYDEKYQKFTFNTTTPLLVDIDYIITIKYTGQLKDDLLGVYYSEYKNGNDTRKLIATHFGQFTRRMMPCWDEPRFKATFKFTVERDEGLHSLSNAMIEKTEGNVDYFKPTSKISTYILALVISDFERRPIPGGVRVYARPNAVDDTEYALKLITRFITYYGRWTDIDYLDIPGVEKMELAAIPDFLAGAMENWGLILVQELYSLYNTSYANTDQKDLIVYTLSHEIAHMWFGNLITCDWFDELYLTEGFARYLQYYVAQIVELDYADMEFSVASTQRALLADSSTKSYPLSNKGMFSVPEIRSMFGPISYDKGASILRMAHFIMGEFIFQDGIRSYLKKRQFKTAKTEDLLTALEKEHEGISDLLAPYIYQAGYPLLSVSREGDILTVTQKRFLLDNKDHNDTTQWTVPITIATKLQDFTNYSNPIPNLVYFKRFHNPLTINITEIKSKYYVFNVRQVGFYRINYDTDNWNAISRELHESFVYIIPVNRAQIIDDLFNLARAGHLTYDFIFSIINYIKKETHYLPWLAFFNGLSHLHERVVNEPLKKQFDAFVNDLLGPITEKLGFDHSGDDWTNRNRIQVLEWACKYGNEGCVSEALEYFERVLKGENIQSDLKPAVYCTGLRETYSNWNKMWDRYVESNYATEQEMILKALGCARNSTDINTFMDKILTKDIRLQNKPAAYISAVSGNLENVDVVLDYLIKNTNKWGEVMDVVWTLGDLSGRFTNVEQFDKFEKHVNTLKDEWKKPLLEVLTENRKLLEWDTARLPELEQFLDNSAVSKRISLILIVLITVKYFLF